VTRNARIFVGTGTFLLGFDELVTAADAAAKALDLDGFAQIGHSRVEPARLRYERFVPVDEMRRAMADSDVVVCHGGVGMLGEAMRAKKPIIAVARRGPTTRSHPAGDQLPFLERLAQSTPVRVCRSPLELVDHLRRVLPTAAEIHYPLQNDFPEIITDFLRSAHSH